MNRFARITTLAIVSLVVAASVSAAAAHDVQSLTVTIEPTDSSVVLGQDLALTVTVTNGGSASSAPLVVHLDITDPSKSSSVDPEDWTSTLSKPIGTLAPGASATVDWAIQPIAGGSFSVYAVLLSPGAITTFVSNVTQVVVADQRSLNPGGILPVALGAPAVVGALLLLQLRMRRRYGR